MTLLNILLDNWVFNKAVIVVATLCLTSCNYTTVEVTDRHCTRWYSGPLEVEVIYTNTSTSKILEVTIKREYSDGHTSTRFEKLKPGQIITICEQKDAEISIVGEREIKEDF
jgi:hypothetical protein